MCWLGKMFADENILPYSHRPVTSLRSRPLFPDMKLKACMTEAALRETTKNISKKLIIKRIKRYKKKIINLFTSSSGSLLR
jgi:hypothetical protein